MRRQLLLSLLVLANVVGSSCLAQAADEIKPASMGGIAIASWEKPIDLNNSYGKASFIANPKSNAELMINQGVAALQVFHYVDAFRSFKMAESEDSTLVMAYVGEMLAATNLSTFESSYFVRNAAKKAVEQANRRVLSTSESGWADFAIAKYAQTSSREAAALGRPVKSIDEAYAEIMSDKSNLDSQGLATWQMLGRLGYDKAKTVFAAILKQDPNNICAHHSLLHIAEAQNDGRAANEHAVELARLAPDSAHAQHMLGHVLPQQGRWEEALVQFKKADAIHHAWSKKYGLALNQDWHYSHNLDLLAATYLGLGDYAQARAAWMEGKGDYRALVHSVKLAVATADKADAEGMIALGEKEMGPRGFVSLRAELALSKENATGTSLEADSVLSTIIQRMIDSYVRGTTDASLSAEISSYIASEFKAGGFDGWSNGYLDLLRIKRVAKILELKVVSDELVPLEFAARNGSLCGASPAVKVDLTKDVP